MPHLASLAANRNRYHLLPHKIWSLNWVSQGKNIRYFIWTWGGEAEWNRGFRIIYAWLPCIIAPLASLGRGAIFWASDSSCKKWGYFKAVKIVKSECFKETRKLIRGLNTSWELMPWVWCLAQVLLFSLQIGVLIYLLAVPSSVSASRITLHPQACEF